MRKKIFINLKILRRTDVKKNYFNWLNDKKNTKYLDVKGCKSLDLLKKYVKNMVKEFNIRRNFLTEKLNNIKNIECVKPGGAFYVFPKVNKLNYNSKEIADYLLEKKYLATVPGSAFGKNGEGFLRISYSNHICPVCGKGQTFPV